MCALTNMKKIIHLTELITAGDNDFEDKYACPLEIILHHVHMQGQKQRIHVCGQRCKESHASRHGNVCL